MSRYNNSGSSNGNENNYDDQVELKLQKFAAIAGDCSRINAFNGNWGDKFITEFGDGAILDGIVFRRDDKPMTLKVFSIGKFGNLNEEDGLVYETHDEDDGYQNQLSAEEILQKPKVRGFFEEFGDNEYNYTPVAVIIEAGDDIAVNEDLFSEDVQGPFTESDLETVGEDGVLPIGDFSMMLSNQTWVRTLAKKFSSRGEGIINDNGADDPDDNPMYDDYEWLTTLDPELPDELEGRRVELWVTEGEREDESGETYTFDVPNVKDVRTDNWVTIGNKVEDDEESDDSADTDNTAQQAATDGGEEQEDDGEDEDEESSDSSEETDGDPEDLPEVLHDLIDYYARTEDGADAEELREFAEDEVESPDEIDWEYAADLVEERA